MGGGFVRSQTHTGLGETESQAFVYNRFNQLSGVKTTHTSTECSFPEETSSSISVAGLALGSEDGISAMTQAIDGITFPIDLDTGVCKLEENAGGAFSPLYGPFACNLADTQPEDPAPEPKPERLCSNSDLLGGSDALGSARTSARLEEIERARWAIARGIAEYTQRNGFYHQGWPLDMGDIPNEGTLPMAQVKARDICDGWCNAVRPGLAECDCPAANADDGDHLWSWRLLTLPWVMQWSGPIWSDLADVLNTIVHPDTGKVCWFDFSEAYNSAHNLWVAREIAKEGKDFNIPYFTSFATLLGGQDLEPGHTTYLLVTGPNTSFPLYDEDDETRRDDHGSRRGQLCTASRTLGLVDVPNKDFSQLWTAPHDLPTEEIGSIGDACVPNVSVSGLDGGHAGGVEEGGSLDPHRNILDLADFQEKCGEDEMMSLGDIRRQPNCNL